MSGSVWLLLMMLTIGICLKMTLKIVSGRVLSKAALVWGMLLHTAWCSYMSFFSHNVFKLASCLPAGFAMILRHAVMPIIGIDVLTILDFVCHVTTGEKSLAVANFSPRVLAENLRCVTPQLRATLTMFLVCSFIVRSSTAGYCSAALACCPACREICQTAEENCQLLQLGSSVCRSRPHEADLFPSNSVPLQLLGRNCSHLTCGALLCANCTLTHLGHFHQVTPHCLSSYVHPHSAPVSCASLV